MKIRINKRILTLLVSGNILLSGCSINSNVVSKNENSSLTEDTNEIEFIYSYNEENFKLQSENSISSKKDNNSKELKDTNSEKDESIIEELDTDLNEYYSVDTNSDTKENIEEYNYVENSDTEQNIIYEENDNIYIRAKETINVRYEPTIESDIMDILYEGNSLKKVGEINNWYIVEYKGLNAYVSKDYCEEIDNNEINNEEMDNDIQEEINGSNVCYFPYGVTIYSDKELTNAICDIPALESGIINYQVGDVYLVDSYGYNGYVSIYSTSIIAQPAIIVDKSEQMLRLYKNNNLAMEFSVVTGNETYDFYNPSEEGLFYIYDKQYNANLVGPTWDVNVGVFMPYNGGEGIHDATWRPYFGGDIYLGDGSHGCINCPYYEVMSLADEVDVGDRVLVKR